MDQIRRQQGPIDASIKPVCDLTLLSKVISRQPLRHPFHPHEREPQPTFQKNVRPSGIRTA
ncbi:hypothetical protein GPN2_11486 [Streptomyces murinus]